MRLDFQAQHCDDVLVHEHNEYIVSFLLFVYNSRMKTIYSSLLVLVALLFTACTPKNEWTTYTVDYDAGILPYSFEYPSSWTMEPGNNHIAFFSKKKLSKDVPEKLKPGQIIVGLSMNISMAPEEMVLLRTEGLDDIIRFDDLISLTLDERPAAYQEGVLHDVNDEMLIIAVDVGQNQRVLLSARMAEGELETWRETLLHMVKSLKVK
ncbi:MAG: hypothetical protein QM730_24170 [Anaerolineales bacterium]